MKIDAGVIDDAGQEFGLPREFYSVAEWGAHARDGHFLADADELEQDPNFAAVEEGEMWDSDDDPNDLDYYGRIPKPRAARVTLREEEATSPEPHPWADLEDDMDADA